MTPALAPIQVFLSYASSDDAEFGMVDPLVSKLKAVVKAKSGRILEIFVDREAIGWGENWRDRLATSVENATIFIPLLTATYLERPACRDEFLAFHSKAKAFGVPELLLPILVFRSPLFSPETSDEIAVVAEALQYKCIEDALVAGTESPQWLAMMRDLAESLLSALTRAETALGSDLHGHELVKATTDSANAGAKDDLDDDADGLTELMEGMEGAVGEMSIAAEGLVPLVERLGEVARKFGDLGEVASASDFRVHTIRLANAFSGPAKDLEGHGHDLFGATKRLDEVLSQIKTLAADIDDEDVRASMTSGLASSIEDFGDLQDVAQGMDQLLQALKPAEVLSVPLRKSIRPARRGLTAVRDAIRIIDSWRYPPGDSAAFSK